MDIWAKGGMGGGPGWAPGEHVLAGQTTIVLGTAGDAPLPRKLSRERCSGPLDSLDVEIPQKS